MLSSCLSLQQFTIHLAAHVTQQYPLSEAVGVVKDIFKRLHVLISQWDPWRQKGHFFKPLQPALTKFCQTFPLLCTDATELLLHLGKLCLVSESNLLSRPDKNLQTVKENLACQVLDASYTAGEMGKYDSWLQTKWGHVTQLIWHFKTSWMGWMESCLLKDYKWCLKTLHFIAQSSYKDVNSSVLSFHDQFLWPPQWFYQGAFVHQMQFFIITACAKVQQNV